MIKPLALAALVSLSGAAASANASDDQLLLLVSAELSNYVQDVDPANLTRHQLGAIYSIMHSGKSQGDKAGQIRSVLGGRFSLRGLFFN